MKQALTWIIVIVICIVWWVTHLEEGSAKNEARNLQQWEELKAKTAEEIRTGRRIEMGQLIELTFSISRPDDPDPSVAVQARGKLDWVPSSIFVLRKTNGRMSYARIASMADLRSIPEYDSNEVIPGDGLEVYRRVSAVPFNGTVNNMNEFQRDMASKVYDLEMELAKYSAMIQ